MRILIYSWRDLKHPLTGGAEVYTDSVAREWVKMGHSVTLFCAAVVGEPDRETLQSGYQIVRKGSRHSVYREAKRYWKREGRGNFDLVIDEVNTRPFFCSSYVKEATVVVLIFQVAREVWFYEANVFVAILGRYIFEPLWLKRLRNAKVVTISESSRRSLLNYGLRNVQVVPVGHNPVTPIMVVKEPVPTVVFIGRLSANKRPDHAANAFKVIRKHIPEARLWIIGDGPMKKRLCKNPIEGVEYLGRIDESEKVKKLASSHLLLVTSVREGWGLVVTEAAGLGIPSVGYSVDGLRDSLRAHGGIATKPNPTALGEVAVKVLSSELLINIDNGQSRRNVLPWDEVAKLLIAH